MTFKSDWETTRAGLVSGPSLGADKTLGFERVPVYAPDFYLFLADRSCLSSPVQAEKEKEKKATIIPTIPLYWEERSLGSLPSLDHLFANQVLGTWLSSQARFMNRIKPIIATLPVPIYGIFHLRTAIHFLTDRSSASNEAKTKHLCYVSFKSGF